jgi:hypothetical protein
LLEFANVQGQAFDLLSEDFFLHGQVGVWLWRRLERSRFHEHNVGCIIVLFNRFIVPES